MTTKIFPEFSPNARAILERRYLREGETPEDMFTRVARAVAMGEPEPLRAEAETLFHDIMRQLRFLPNSPTLVNATVIEDEGEDEDQQKQAPGSLSACYTISPQDDMNSIMRIATDAALIEKSGGGVGFGLSRLRPKNDAIRTTHGSACGPVAVMKLYSTVGQTLTQGAFREGAHMGQLPVNHPDIREFIHCKDNDDTLANFNISVQITDEFMEKVLSDDEIDLINPRDRGKGPENTPAGKIRAKELWNEIIQSAWKTGDPGVVYIDRVHEAAPNPQLGQILTSNPCSEEFMEDYGNCCLGSINLAAHVNPETMTIDMDMLRDTVQIAVRFLNDVIEVNTFPLEKLREMNQATRRIGLGVMGWADALVMMNMPYDSLNAIDLAQKLSEFITDTGWKQSGEMAKERGPFPEWENSAVKDRLPFPVLNSSLTTIAPTGTISRIADCSSGIEPHYSLIYRSNVLWKDGEKSVQLMDAPAPLRAQIDRNSAGDLQAILARLFENPEDIERYVNPSIFRTSHQVASLDHIKMQAAWQKHVSNGVSKTINMPNSATETEVGNAYLAAWTLGCKAISVYRDGSKSQQVLETAETQAKEGGEPAPTNYYVKPADRPKSLTGQSYKIESSSGRMYVTINDHEGRMFETFINLGKTDPGEQAHLEGISRLISLALRSRIHPEEIIGQLAGITSTPIWYESTLIRSPEDGVAKLMAAHLDNNEPSGDDSRFAAQPNSLQGRLPGMNSDDKIQTPKMCPQSGCSGIVLHIEGCLTCQNCGHSKCD